MVKRNSELGAEEKRLGLLHVYVFEHLMAGQAIYAFGAHFPGLMQDSATGSLQLVRISGEAVRLKPLHQGLLGQVDATSQAELQHGIVVEEPRRSIGS